jgi:hypothetical protein
LDCYVATGVPYAAMVALFEDFRVFRVATASACGPTIDTSKGMSGLRQAGRRL